MILCGRGERNLHVGSCVIPIYSLEIQAEPEAVMQCMDKYRGLKKLNEQQSFYDDFINGKFKKFFKITYVYDLSVNTTVDAVKKGLTLRMPKGSTGCIDQLVEKICNEDKHNGDSVAFELLEDGFTVIFYVNDERVHEVSCAALWKAFPGLYLDSATAFPALKKTALSDLEIRLRGKKLKNNMMLGKKTSRRSIRDLPIPKFGSMRKNVVDRFSFRRSKSIDEFTPPNTITRSLSDVPPPSRLKLNEEIENKPSNVQVPVATDTKPSKSNAGHQFFIGAYSVCFVGVLINFALGAQFASLVLFGLWVIMSIVGIETSKDHSLRTYFHSTVSYVMGFPDLVESKLSLLDSPVTGGATKV